MRYLRLSSRSDRRLDARLTEPERAGPIETSAMPMRSHPCQIGQPSPTASPPAPAVADRVGGRAGRRAARPGSASRHRDAGHADEMPIPEPYARRRRKRIADVAAGIALVGFACLTMGRLAAQTCPAPAVLAANTPTGFDTCRGGAGVVIACGAFALTGPATIVRMPLPYPIGRLVVQSGAGFDPALFLLRSQCGNTAACGYVTDSGIAVDTIDLAEVDSGDYFLAIAPWRWESTPCGQVLVTLELTPQELALTLDGMFRGGLDAPLIAS
jgi:hypothetical protein